MITESVVVPRRQSDLSIIHGNVTKMGIIVVQRKIMILDQIVDIMMLVQHINHHEHVVKQEHGAGPSRHAVLAITVSMLHR
jgi:hypothetical protein